VTRQSNGGSWGAALGRYAGGLTPSEYGKQHLPQDGAKLGGPLLVEGIRILLIHVAALSQLELDCMEVIGWGPILTSDVSACEATVEDGAVAIVSLGDLEKRLCQVRVAGRARGAAQIEVG